MAILVARDALRKHELLAAALHKTVVRGSDPCNCRPILIAPSFAASCPRPHHDLDSRESAVPGTRHCTTRCQGRMEDLQSRGGDALSWKQHGYSRWVRAQQLRTHSTDSLRGWHAAVWGRGRTSRGRNSTGVTSRVRIWQRAGRDVDECQRAGWPGLALTVLVSGRGRTSHQLPARGGASLGSRDRLLLALSLALLNLAATRLQPISVFDSYGML